MNADLARRAERYANNPAYARSRRPTVTLIQRDTDYTEAMPA